MRGHGEIGRIEEEQLVLAGGEQLLAVGRPAEPRIALVLA